MECNVQLISDLNQLEYEVDKMAKDYSHSEILISGIWNKNIYEGILNSLILSNCAHMCKIIIPGIPNNTIIPRYTMRKITGLNGQVRISCKLNNSMLIIGENVFIPSFSFNQGNSSAKAKLECCMVTDNLNVVDEVRNRFVSVWESSLPLISEVV